MLELDGRQSRGPKVISFSSLPLPLSFRCPEPVEREEVASGFVSTSSTNLRGKDLELAVPELVEGSKGRKGWRLPCLWGSFRQAQRTEGGRGKDLEPVERSEGAGGSGDFEVRFDTLRQAQGPSSTGSPLSRRRGEGCKSGPQISLSVPPDSLPFTRRGRLIPIRLLSSPPPSWGRARERGKLQLSVTADAASKGNSLCMDSCFRRNDEFGTRDSDFRCCLLLNISCRKNDIQQAFAQVPRCCLAIEELSEAQMCAPGGLSRRGMDDARVLRSNARTRRARRNPCTS